MPPEAQLDWKEITGEEERTYHFPGGDRYTVREVVKLCVRPSGNHRLETKDGKKHIIRAGWIAIEAKSSHWSC